MKKTYCDMCGKEVHEKPQSRDDPREFLQYGRVKLILKPLYPDAYTDTTETSYDLCEECRDVIESFIDCLVGTKRHIEKRGVTIDEFLKDKELISRIANINTAVLKIYQFYRRTRIIRRTRKQRMGKD